jgi:RND family efflux transporter MFP subunit
MRFIALLLMTAPLWLLAACTGCGHRAGGSAAAQAASSAAAAIDRVVAGPPVRKTLVLTTTQPARIEAYEVTPLLAKLAGYVGEVRVDIGDAVEQDQPLAVLRIPELNDEVAQRQALVAQAEAEVRQALAAAAAARAAGEPAVARIGEAQAGISGARADAERWTAEHERIEQLAAGGSVTRKLVDESASQLASARAAVERATAAVASAEAAAREAQALVAKAEADHAAEEAHLRVARADLAYAKTMLGYATLSAPFDGVVTQRAIDTGHFVQPAGGGGRPLLTVARTDKVRVWVDVPELEAGWVEVGDPVSLTIQALAGETVQGRVTRSSWSLDPANRSLRAEIDLPNEGGRFRPGMYAMATIELARRENALTLPAAAIVRDGPQTFVATVSDGTAARRPVKLGLRAGPDVEILEGVDEHASVVQIRAESLADGQRVEVIAPQP